MPSWPDRIEKFLWDPDRPAGRRGLAGILPLRFLYALGRDVLGGQLTLRAMGLVYVTIMAIVPVIAISFSVLKAFGLHRHLEPLLNTWFAPLGDQSAIITARIIAFVDNVQGDFLAGFGLALLFLTTLSMARRVEGALNYIWQVDPPRKIARRLGDYLTVILVGPVVMLTAMGLIASLESHVIPRQLAELEISGRLLRGWGMAAPYLLVCAAFSGVYRLVPNTKVAWGAALAGGIAGGLLWAGSGVLFTRFVVASAQTASIYSTFAVVIVGLVWVYLCWLVLLIGAQVAFYVQFPAYLRLGHRPFQLGGSHLEQAALSVMLLVARSFGQAGPRPTLHSLAGSMQVPAGVLRPVLTRLEDAGLLTATGAGEWLPNRDPDQVTVQEILSAARTSRVMDLIAGRHWPAEIVDLVSRLEAARDRELGDVTLGQLAASGRGESRDG